MVRKSGTNRFNRRAFMQGVGRDRGSARRGFRSSRRRCTPPRRIKLGYVSPQTGPLAAFAEADNFIISELPRAR